MEKNTPIYINYPFLFIWLHPFPYRNMHDSKASLKVWKIIQLKDLKENRQITYSYFTYQNINVKYNKVSF